MEKDQSQGGKTSTKCREVLGNKSGLGAKHPWDKAYYKWKQSWLSFGSLFLLQTTKFRPSMRFLKSQTKFHTN